MILTYAQFSQLPASEKVVLCTADATTEYKIWTLAGSVYYKDVDHFVYGVKVDGANLTSTNSAILSVGQFFFDSSAKRLYIRLIGDVVPKTKRVVIYHRFFFSTKPVILPYDLNLGADVEWDGRIENTGNLGQQLDDENTGIVLESSSQIELHNMDGYFDGIIDTLIWEHQTIEFWSWSPKIPASSAYKIFSGLIESKMFSSDRVTFRVKDFVYKLKNSVNLLTFSVSDGKLSDSDLGKPKRRIYGKVKQAPCVGIDKTLSGLALTGTVTATLASLNMSGTGTIFLTQLSPGDEIYVVISGVSVKFSVDSITSDTALILGDESEYSITAQPATFKPAIPYRLKNRRWHIAGHKLHEPSSTITAVIKSNRFEVNNILDFEPTDLIYINGDGFNLRRISNNNFVMEQAIFPLPLVGDIFTKIPVTKVYYGSKLLVYERDWLLENTANNSIIVLDPLVERNIANSKSIGVSLTFTSGSRSVTTASTVDLGAILKPRDWIRKNHISENAWYEVLSVAAQTITLRTAFVGTTGAATGFMKNVEIADDDSLITVDCIGAASTDATPIWLRTPSDIVKHLVMNDAGFADIDETAFAQAKSDCGHTMSLLVPESIGDKSPSIKDVITKINESVFGSLYGNSTQEIAASILNARKPTSQVIIQDDDIISWSAKTDQRIVNKVKVNYRKFTDIYNGVGAEEIVEYTNSFVDDFIALQNTAEITSYLYDTSAATIIAQRVAFFRSLSTCTVTLKGKLNFALTAVNDKMFIELDRLFKRYGGFDRKKIAMVVGVKKNGFDVDIELSDLGNIFNRIPVVAATGTGAYSDCTRDQITLYGFILDNNTLTPDNTSETDLGNNRIG